MRLLLEDGFSEISQPSSYYLRKTSSYLEKDRTKIGLIFTRYYKYE